MDRAELRRLAEAVLAAKEDFEKNKFYDGCGYYSDRYAEAKYQFEKAANPAAIIELLDEIKSLKCCGNCKHSAMNFSGGSKMLCKMRIMGAMDNYAKEKCEKWQGVK